MEGKDIINAEKLKPFDVYGNVLYHYCSMETFKSIIEKKELWLCNARHSNDSAELQYIMYIAKQMKKDKKEKLTDRSDEIDQIELHIESGDR